MEASTNAVGVLMNPPRCVEVKRAVRRRITHRRAFRGRAAARGRRARLVILGWNGVPSCRMTRGPGGTLREGLRGGRRAGDASGGPGPIGARPGTFVAPGC